MFAWDISETEKYVSRNLFNIQFYINCIENCTRYLHK